MDHHHRVGVREPLRHLVFHVHVAHRRRPLAGRIDGAADKEIALLGDDERPGLGARPGQRQQRSAGPDQGGRRRPQDFVQEPVVSTHMHSSQCGALHFADAPLSLVATLFGAGQPCNMAGAADAGECGWPLF
jgi:hypothetical protein